MEIRQRQFAIRYKDYFSSVKNYIRTTPYFGTVQWFQDVGAEEWKKVDTSKVKGVWSADSVYFKFVEKTGTHAQETLFLSVDTISGKCEFTYRAI